MNSDIGKARSLDSRVGLYSVILDIYMDAFFSVYVFHLLHLFTKFSKLKIEILKLVSYKVDFGRIKKNIAKSLKLQEITKGKFDNNYNCIIVT